MKDTPLDLLAAESGRSFPTLAAARERTRTGLAERRRRLSELAHDQDAAVVLMGSWGRAEVTSGSDDDFMLLVHGHPRFEVRPSIEDVASILDRAPGGQGIFGSPVFSDQLIGKIGLEEDSNSNLSRRMLFLLESVHATNEGVYEDARHELLVRYLDQSVKDLRPPRFLLNDVIRYWRTICVDFAGKEHEGPDKWGLRNAKLRTYRKVLFAGGLLPVLSCVDYGRERMPAFLAAQFAMPPTDRIAEAFLNHGAVDAGARTLGAYDAVLALFDDPMWRSELDQTTREEARNSEAFREVSRLGDTLQQGLLALLFETETLPELVREYGIF